MKLIGVGEKRLSDQRTSLQKAAQKDKQAAFWKGLVWGVGGTVAVVVVATAAAVIYYIITTLPAQTTKPLVLRHQYLLEGVPL